MNKKLTTIILLVIPILIVVFIAAYKVKEPLFINRSKMFETKVGNSEHKESIKKAISEKNLWLLESFEIAVNKNDGKYASGSVWPKDSELKGGTWFAKNINGSWKIIWDGNGLIDCPSLKDYSDFPSQLIPECLNQDTGELVRR